MPIAIDASTGDLGLRHRYSLGAWDMATQGCQAQTTAMVFQEAVKAWEEQLLMFSQWEVVLLFPAISGVVHIYI